MLSDEEFICPVCGEHHQWRSGVVVISRAATSVGTKEIVGWKLCELHDQHFNQSMVFLVGIEGVHTEEKTLQPDDVVRTGDYASVAQETFKSMFDGIEVPESRIIYCSTKVILALAQTLQRMQQLAKESEHATKH